MHPPLNPAILIGVGILSLVIAAVIFKAVFAINKFLWYQQKQLDILIQIARKHNVDDLEIHEILERKV